MRKSIHEPDILFVEDDPIINLSTATILEEMGCKVTAVVHLAAAWESVRQQLPDAAVLDVNLQGNSTTLELADWLDRKGVPVVFLTAHESPSLREWLDHPVSQKPCDPDELERLVVEALNKKLGQR